MTVSSFLYHVASGDPFLASKTIDSERFIHAVADQTQEKLARKTYVWDIVTGIKDIIEDEEVDFDEMEDTPIQPLAFLKENEEPCVMIVLDYHKYWGEVDVYRRLLNMKNRLKEKAQTIIFALPSMEIPLEINSYVTVFEFPLPTVNELFNKAVLFAEEVEMREEYSDDELMSLAESARGLHSFELENALALSLSKEGRFTREFISEQRQQMIRKSGALKLFESNFGFESVIGYDRLKDFAKKMVLSGKGRGILLLGVPGAGKTLFGKSLGRETDRPTIIMDPGAMKGSLVGQTEQQTQLSLDIIDAQGNCIVFFDEIEKALAGVNDTANAVNVSQSGSILKWMNDRDSGSYVIATANDISKLPPEWLRAERWDAIMFVDVPTKKELEDLLEFYLKEYQFEKGSFDVENISGWTGAEVKSLVRIASSLEVSLNEAMMYINPICQTGDAKISALREWASKRAISASYDSPIEEVETDSKPKRRIEKISV